MNQFKKGRFYRSSLTYFAALLLLMTSRALS